MKIKDLKRIIYGLPDNMLVKTLDSEDVYRDVMAYIHSPNEAKEKYQEEQLVISPLDKELLKWVQK